MAAAVREVEDADGHEAGFSRRRHVAEANGDQPLLRCYGEAQVSRESARRLREGERPLPSPPRGRRGNPCEGGKRRESDAKHLLFFRMFQSRCERTPPNRNLKP